jgi:dienelactone hydrolase
MNTSTANLSSRWLLRLSVLSLALYPCCGSEGDGVAAGSDWGTRAAALSGPVFDLASIRDASTADCRFEGERTVNRGGTLLRVWNVSYLSWEWRAKEGGSEAGLRPIRIRAFAARPATSARLPAIVQAHGLGGFADENAAVSTAARLGLFVLAYTGPGGGNRPDNTSEGKPASDGSGYRMFDTLADVRGSWFYGHTTAALRGLTCLAARTDVVADKLGMTGFSAGGVATLLASGADSRIKAAVPLSGVLAWDEAVRSPNAWQHALLGQAGLSATSTEWTTLQRDLIAPVRALASTTAALFLVNGSSDEFFPLNAHRATLAGLPSGSGARSSLIANFDHGCYKLSGGESASSIEARATLRAEGGQRAFFRHHLLADPAYPAIPRPPSVVASSAGAATYVVAGVDRPAGLEIDEVRLWWSSDSAFLFASQTLTPKSGGVYDKLVPLPLSSASAYFVDVQYRTRGLFPARFSVSSDPVLAAGFVPRIRAINTCL